MKPALFYDTETSGLPLFKEPSDSPAQPHIVQLAATLVDLDTRKTMQSLDLIVRPEGWTIPEEVALVHGITTAHAAAFGVPEGQALDLFIQLWGLADVRIAHNESFDARIVRIALMRQDEPMARASADVWKGAAAECTQLLSTPILQLPPTEKMKAAKRFHYKSANLGEAVQFFTGKPLENAHSAMADVKGCMDVYFAIADRLAAAA